MGNSESFDLVHNTTTKKEVNSIYNFDLNGIFRRIGDIDSINNTTTNNFFKQENSILIDDENEIIDLTDTKSLDENYNERLIDGLDDLPSNEIVTNNNEEQHKEQNLNDDEIPIPNEPDNEEETNSISNYEAKPAELSIDNKET